jgi:signal transduction histidine kinase
MHGVGPSTRDRKRTEPARGRAGSGPRATRSDSLRAKAMAGYAAVILLLAAGMVFAIRRLDVLTTAEVAHIRAREKEITHAERLRWTGELIVSDGRGYLVSGEPELRARLAQAATEFDRAVDALAVEGLTPEGASLTASAKEAARAFRQRQAELLAARDRGEDVRALARRFEAELLPLRRELALSLDRLASRKQWVIEQAYEIGESNRANLTFAMYGLLGVLLTAGLGMAWLFTGMLARSHRETEAALQAARRAVAARDELSGIVAHDLRNPVGAIMMKAALLKRHVDSDKAREHADSIVSLTSQMEHLIRTMLDVAIIEAGRFSVTATTCDVGDLLGEAFDMFGSLCAPKGIRLERRRLEPGLRVTADRARVLQCLSNLLGNALKFTPEGGEVILRAERQGPMVRFEVEDTGPGIPRENLPHLFERFWKDETGGHQGTGLGLFIAYGIVNAHGGRIWAESEPGRGATFCFTLPAAPADRAATVAEETESLPAHA